MSFTQHGISKIEAMEDLREAGLAMQLSTAVMHSRACALRGNAMIGAGMTPGEMDSHAVRNRLWTV